MMNDRVAILLASCAREEIEEQDWKERVVELKDLNILNEREYEAFVMYYTESKTLEEIGNDMNVNKERVRQILKKCEWRIIKNQRARALLSKGYQAYNTENYIKLLEEIINELNKEIYDKKCEVNRLITRYDILSNRVKEDGVAYLSQVKLEELNLSTRAYHALRWEFWRLEKEPTLESLLDLSIEDLYKIRNIGTLSRNEIIEKVHSKGYKFKGEDNEIK